MNIPKPLADRVLVEPEVAKEKTASGLYIPDSAKEKINRGKVIACGDGKTNEPMTVKPGDTVLYSPYSETEVVVDGKKLLMMRESDVMMIIGVSTE